MYHRDGHIVNYVNATQFAAQMSAFGEFWRRLSQLDKFNTCHWHSACTKFGGLENLITLSQALAYKRIVQHLIIRAGRPRQDTASFAEMQGRPQCFLSPATKIPASIFQSTFY